jgi:hypothetical protein
MGRLVLTLFIFFSAFEFSYEAPVIGTYLPLIYPDSTIHDTIPDRQLLFNGRIVRSSYSKIIGHQFFLTKDWLKGDVNINEITFHNIQLKYDIYNDQLIAFLNQVTAVQLNKELIKEFTLTIENRKDIFENFNTGKDNPVNGFGQVLYKGDIYLINKYVKRIQQLAISNRYDEFYQQQALYILKGGNFYKVTGKKDLINILSDKKQQVQKYIKENKIRIRKKDPASFIPVLKFYDAFKNVV